MNPEELKIGDLVRVVKDDYIILKGTICKVIGVNAIDFSEFGGHKPVVSLSTVNKEEEIRSMSCKNIEGIPLTKDILLKNGWELNYGFYWSPNEEGAGVGLSSQTGYIWEAYIGRHLLRSNINNVSDLQHLLFGLGLDSNMIV